MTLALPIKWSLFFAGDVIGLALPTNLLVMDGIKRGGEVILFLVLRDSPFSSSLVLRKSPVAAEKLAVRTLVAHGAPVL